MTFYYTDKLTELTFNVGAAPLRRERPSCDVKRGLYVGGCEAGCLRSETQLSVQHRLPPARCPLLCSAAGLCVWFVLRQQKQCPHGRETVAHPLLLLLLLDDTHNNQVTPKLMARHSHSHGKPVLTMDSWPMMVVFACSSLQVQKVKIINKK